MSMPPAYLGVWQRRLLRTPTLEDTTTTVLWLQTAGWHADIRIPADRPHCRGRRSLVDLSREELLGLACQQGFAGWTRVEDNVCHWDRKADFQPPSGFNDIGRIEFSSPDLMLEYGIEQEYFEIWERIPNSVGNEHVDLQFESGNDTRTARPRSVLLATGDYFIHVRPRPMTLPQAESLASLTGDDESLRAALDFEISFGIRSGATIASWVIQRSTFPWREGERLGMV